MDVRSTDIVWSERMFASLADGGEWGVPRSGLFFRKRGNLLALESVMPHDPAMPLTETELREYQQEDLDAIRTVFGMAGIEVTGTVDNAAASLTGDMPSLDGRSRSAGWKEG